jgi:hypothetical protein
LRQIVIKYLLITNKEYKDLLFRNNTENIPYGVGDETEYEFNEDYEVKIEDYVIGCKRNYNSLKEDLINEKDLIKIKNKYSSFIQNRISCFLVFAVMSKDQENFEKYMLLAISCFFNLQRNHINCLFKDGEDPDKDLLKGHDMCYRGNLKMILTNLKDSPDSIIDSNLFKEFFELEDNFYDETTGKINFQNITRKEMNNSIILTELKKIKITEFKKIKIKNSNFYSIFEAMLTSTTYLLLEII